MSSKGKSRTKSSRGKLKKKSSKKSVKKTPELSSAEQLKQVDESIKQLKEDIDAEQTEIVVDEVKENQLNDKKDHKEDNTEEDHTEDTEDNKEDNKEDDKTEVDKTEVDNTEDNKTEVDDTEKKTDVINLTNVNDIDQGKKKKKEKNVDIANNAFHRLARKAGAVLISITVNYTYNEILHVLMKRIVKKALVLSAASQSRIIKREVLCRAIQCETGKYPIATVASGRKALLPNFKSGKSDRVTKKVIGRIAEQEISAFQKQSDMLYIAKTPFGNKIKKLTDQYTREVNILYRSMGTKNNVDYSYMFQNGVFLILQSFAEQFLLDLTQCALKLTAHAKRGTLYSEDILLALEINNNLGNILNLPIDEIRTRIKISIERDHVKHVKKK